MGRWSVIKSKRARLQVYKHHERRVAPTPVGWLKALRPNSLSAPACYLLAWGRSGSTMSGLGKKGKQAKSKSQACPRPPLVNQNSWGIFVWFKTESKSWSIAG